MPYVLIRRPGLISARVYLSEGRQLYGAPARGPRESYGSEGVYLTGVWRLGDEVVVQTHSILSDPERPGRPIGTLYHYADKDEIARLATVNHIDGLP